MQRVSPIASGARRCADDGSDNARQRHATPTRHLAGARAQCAAWRASARRAGGRPVHALVLVMATGIAVRLLDGLPRNKHSDPAVVVLDEAARYAISLLAGHEGGANRL